MSTVTDKRLKAQQLCKVNSSQNILAALARQARESQESTTNGSNSLLSRMYPALSHEQAEAVIRQQIALEELRKTASSRQEQ